METWNLHFPSNIHSPFDIGVGSLAVYSILVNSCFVPCILTVVGLQMKLSYRVV